MKTRRRKVVTSVIVVVGLGVLAAAGISLRGFIVEQWYLWKLESEEESQRETAAKALGEMGSTRAILPLISILREAAEEPVELVNVAPKSTGPGFQAVKNLAFPIHYSSKALTKIGEPAVPALVEVLKEKKPNERDHVTTALANIGAPAVSALIELFEHEDRVVRELTVYTLRRVAPTPVPELIRALGSSSGNTRRYAAIVLGSARPKPVAAIPALQKTLKDQDELVRVAAQKALDRIGGARQTSTTRRASNP